MESIKNSLYSFLSNKLKYESFTSELKKQSPSLKTEERELLKKAVRKK
jgi:hypothetical protein